MCRLWFQGGPFIAAARALVVLGVVNCLASVAAELRVRQPAFPTTNRIRLELEGLAPTQQAQVQAIPTLATPTAAFTPLVTGQQGESVFEIPIPWSEEGYFRALVWDAEIKSGLIELEIPTALQRFVPGQSIRLAPQGAVRSPARATLDGGWVDVSASSRLQNSEHLDVASSERLKSAADGGIRLLGIEIAKVDRHSNGLRLRLGPGATPEAVGEVLRQVRYSNSHSQRLPQFRIIQWEVSDGQGRRSRRCVQTLEMVNDCDQPLDVVLVLDRTGSISPSDFGHLRDAATQFVGHLSLAPELRRVGVVSFCASAFTYAELTADENHLKQTIAGLQRGSSVNGVLCDGTVVGSGVREAMRLLNQPDHRRAILLLTDGWESSTTAQAETVQRATVEAANEAQNHGIRLLVYALGVAPDVAHLRRLVADPEDYFHSADYGRLPGLLSEMAKSFCDTRSPLPQIDAGTDLQVWLPEAATLRGTCSSCSGTAHARWEILEGPGSVSLSASSLTTEAAFSEPGIYRFRLTVSDGLYRSSDDLQVTVLRANQPPQVRIDLDQIARDQAFLSAKVMDDFQDERGLHSDEPLQHEWFKGSGPGEIKIERPAESRTFVTFSEPGDYDVGVRVRDAGGLSATNLVTLRVASESSWELFHDMGYASAGVGGLRDGGSASISLRGVHGPVRRAYLYWHGPVDSEDPGANARIRFEGRWIQGRSLGISHDDGWTYEHNHPFVTGQAYRADVTAMVTGNGEYSVTDLTKLSSFNVNGASLIVVFEDPEPSARRDVRLWSGNESNGGFSQAVNGEVHALTLQPDERILLGGAFTEIGGFNRSRIGRLHSTGEIDLGFDPGSGADGIVRAIVVHSDDGITVGGSFRHFNGVVRPGVARLHPDGALQIGYQPDLPGGEDVHAMLEWAGHLWLGGSFGICRLDGEGRRVTEWHLGVEVRTIVAAADGSLWFGGHRLNSDASQPGWLARLTSDGEVDAVACEVDGPILTLAGSDDGYLYAGGRFSAWNGATRHGLARVQSRGELDVDWIPESLNQSADQEVTSLWIQTPGPDQPWYTSLVVVGGSLWLREESGVVPVALCRLVDGSTTDDPFEKLPRSRQERIGAISSAGQNGDLWIGGRFVKHIHRNRARINQGGGLVASNSGDEGWSLLLETGPNPAQSELELHVSDGQPCFECMGRSGGLFLDPVLLLNDRPWKAPATQTLCDAEQEQLFAGLSVPSSSNECWRGTGLWDILRAPLAGFERGKQPLVLRTEYQGASSQEDLVTLVAAAVLSPSSGEGVGLPQAGEFLARDDDFALVRREGAQRLPVLSNDWLPRGAKILAISQPSVGSVFIPQDATSIVFQPDLGEGHESAAFSYVAGWGEGNVSTGHVTLTLSGPAPLPLPEQGTSMPQGLTSGPSQSRGPRHFSQTFLYEAVGAERLDIAVLDPEFSAHLYLRNPLGDLVAAAWHDSDPFGAFSPHITPVYLSYEIPHAGAYWIEVAGDRPAEGGAYVLQVGHEWPDAPLLGLRVNQIEVDDDFELGWVPPPEFVLDVQWVNLTGLRLPDVRFEAFCDHPSVEVTVSSENSQEVLAGEAGRWFCRLRFLESAADGVAEVVLRASVAGRIERRAVGRFRPGSESPRLHLQARPLAAGVFELEAIALAELPPSPTTFVVESGPRQLSLRSEGSFLVWSNVAPGRYTLWAQTESAVSQKSPLAVGPSSHQGSAQADHFEVGLGSSSNRLAVLANDGNATRVLAVTPGRLGHVLLLPDGSLEYSPVPDVLGTEVLNYTALSSDGVQMTAEVTIEIIEPAIRWVQPLPESRHPPGLPIPIEIETDPTRVPVVEARFFANDRPIPHPDGSILQVFWAPDRSGFVTLRAEVLDEQGRWWKSRPVRIGVGVLEDRSPIGILSWPGSGDLVDVDRLNVRGTAMDPDEASTYQLVLRQVDGTVVQTRAGIGSVTDALLGEFDLTLLRNGPFDLSLYVTGGVRVAEQTVRFVLQNNAKVGQFVFTESDLELSTGGAPLVLSRTYDSLNSKGGDFGPGWTLSLYDMQVEIDEERERRFDPDTETSHEVRVGGGRDITLTLPGGLRTTFRYSLKPGPSDGGIPCFCYWAQWTPPPGIPVSLTPIGNRELRFVPFQQDVPPFWSDAGPGTPMENYDFRGWTLTNVGGMVLQIQRPIRGSIELESEGAIARSVGVYGRPVLRSIRMSTGERVEISEGAEFRIDHLDLLNRRTRSLALRRGPHGLITEVYDSTTLTQQGEILPGSLPVLRYEYDPQTRNLVAVIRLLDRESGRSATRRYAYGNHQYPHYLTQITDERGVAVMQAGYDPDGRLIGITDAQGQTTHLEHDRQRRREEFVNPLGHRSFHDYDTHGNVVQSIDPIGRVTRRGFGENHLLLAETNGWGTDGESWVVRSYDALGRLSSLVDRQGTNLLVFDPQSRLLSHREPSGVLTTNRYDAQGHLTNSMRTAGGVSQETQSLFDAAGQLAVSRDPSGLVTRYVYDATGALTNQTLFSPEGRILGSTGMSYDHNGTRQTEVSMRTGYDGQIEFGIHKFVYDAQNRLVRTTDPLGNDREDVLDEQGRLLARRDELGRWTENFYDRQGLLIQTLYPSDANAPRVVTRTVYDSMAKPVFAQQATFLPDPESAAESLLVSCGTYTVYDPLGRAIRAGQCKNLGIRVTLDSDGIPQAELVGTPEILSSMETGYDAAGRIGWTRDANGVRTAYGYDSAGRRSAVTNAWGSPRETVQRSVYLHTGLLEASIDPLGHLTEFRYDAWGRRVSTWFPAVDGKRSMVSSAYDSAGRQIATTNELGIATWFGYDAMGRLISVTNAVGSSNQLVARYEFDESGNQIGQTDAMGRLTRYAYDALGRRVMRQLPAGEKELLGYDAVGNILVRTNFNGRVIEQQFDARDRLIRKVERLPQGEELLAQFTYTATGRRAFQIDPSGSTRYEHDDWDRLRLWDKPGWGRLEDQYLPDGQVSSTLVETENESWQVRYDYDEHGRLTGASVPRFGVGATYVYDAAGMLSETRYANGLTNSYRYDDRSRLESLTWASGGELRARFKYQFNEMGQRFRLDEEFPISGSQPRTYQWDYDDLQRLTRETISDLGSASYQYDRVGNRLRRDSTLPGIPSVRLNYDSNDRIDPDANPSNANPNYDASGNTIRGEYQGRSYEDRYDAENRLVERRYLSE